MVQNLRNRITDRIAAGFMVLTAGLVSGCAHGPKNLEKIGNVPEVHVSQPAPAKLLNARCEVAMRTRGRGLGYCVEYKDMSPAMADKVMAICTRATEGKFMAESDCSTEERIGSCTYQHAGISFIYYYYPPMTREEASKSCKATFAGDQSTAGEWNALTNPTAQPAL